MDRTRDEQLQDHLDAVVEGFSKRDKHVRTSLGISAMRAVVAILSFTRDNDLVSVLLDMKNRDEAIIEIEKRIREEERNRLVGLLTTEANRSFEACQPDYPCNTLDIVAANLRAGLETKLTDMPEWMAKQRRPVT